MDSDGPFVGGLEWVLVALHSPGGHVLDPANQAVTAAHIDHGLREASSLGADRARALRESTPDTLAEAVIAETGTVHPTPLRGPHSRATSLTPVHDIDISASTAAHTLAAAAHPGLRTMHGKGSHAPD